MSRNYPEELELLPSYYRNPRRDVFPWKAYKEGGDGEEKWADDPENERESKTGENSDCELEMYAERVEPSDYQCLVRLPFLSKAACSDPGLASCNFIENHYLVLELPGGKQVISNLDYAFVDYGAVLINRGQAVAGERLYFVRRCDFEIAVDLTDCMTELEEFVNREFTFHNGDDETWTVNMNKSNVVWARRHEYFCCS